MHPVLDREVLTNDSQSRSTVASERPSALRSETYSSLKRSHSTRVGAYDISLNCLRASEFSAFGNFACTFSARWFQHL